MIDIILKTAISFFAIYGFIHIIKDMLNLIFLGDKSMDDIVVVVKVQNSENTLEATIRLILWRCLRFTGGKFIPNILIVDMGSDDKTSEIAKRLCEDYSFIEYTTNELYLKSKKK